MDQDAEAVRAVLSQVPLSLLQFHGSEEAGFCRQFGLPYIKALSIGDETALSAAERDYTDAAALLLDSHEPGGLGGTGKVFDWARIPQTARPLVLAGGLNPQNVARAVRQVKPWAVDVSSGVEDAPGRKNTEKMQAFINEAKREY
jgi:phosphoribosylanthranilate isomerase